MKTSKIALYVVLLPIAFIVVASSLFLAIFDANDYKQELADYVKQSSGRSLVFNGDVELMLYPNFGMKLGAIQFSNAPGFGSKPMLTIKEVSISVDVKSVLMLQPKVSQLILSELHIDLQKNKLGVTNWDDLTPKKERQENPSTPKNIDKQETADKNSFEIAGAFDGININNAQVSWHDATTGASFNIDDLDFTTGKITPTEPFPLTLQLLMHKQNDVNASVNFNAMVFFNQKTNAIHLNELDLKLKAHGDLVPVEQSNISVKGDLSFDLKQQLLNASNLMLLIKTQGGVMQKTDMQISGELSMDLKTQHLQISQLNMTADIQDSSMPKGQLTSLIKSKLLSVYLNQRKIQLSELQLGINNILFKGNIQVHDYAQPAVSFQLATDEVDLDELLGLADQTAVKSDTSTTEAIKNSDDIEIILPTELLRTLDLDGQITIAKLKTMNVVTSNNKLTLKAKKGLIKISPLALNLYDGALSQNVIIDVRSKQPKYTIKTRLDKVQIGDLLIDFMQLDKISGAGTISIDVKTQGNWVSKLKSNLNGKVSLNFADGSLKGFNIRHLIDVAKAKLSGGKKPPEDTLETDFTELKLSGKILNGVFSSNDLSLKSPLIRVGGEGQADLNTDEIDYIVNAKIISSLEGQSGEGLDASGLLVPVRIFGPFSAPKTDILIDNILKQKAQKKLAESKAALSAKKEALKEKLKIKNKAKIDAKKAKLKDKLKGLFK